jgi:serine/threonine-protein kinase
VSITRPVNVVPPAEPPQLGGELLGARPARVALAAGAKLGRYEVLAPLGAGGMAQVWLAEQAGELGFRKLVALKVIGDEHAANPQVRKMFLDEARIASRIRHANVVDVLDLGEHGEKIFLAMEFVEGASLGAVLVAHGPLAAAVTARVMLDTLNGLHAAHELRDDDGVELGLVHRDVSPQNVLVGVDGVAKIADFGIAKALGRVSEVTQVGHWKGKIRYVAPEQLDGMPATRSTDIFSTGVVMWEALTGKALFKSSDRMIRDDPAPDPREIVREVPGPIAAVVMKALAQRPGERFHTALEMAEALEEAARRAGTLASHREIAEIVKGSMGEALASLREVMRARRRGEPLPEYVAPRSGLESEVAPARPSAHHARRMLGASVVVGFCLAVVTGVVVARTGGEPEATPAPVAPPPAAATEEPASAAPNATVVDTTPQPKTLNDDLSPRPASRPIRKVPKPASKGAPRPHSSTGDRPTFDNPYE